MDAGERYLPRVADPAPCERVLKLWHLFCLALLPFANANPYVAS